jgi:hypothetical protein
MQTGSNIPCTSGWCCAARSHPRASTVVLVAHALVDRVALVACVSSRHKAFNSNGELTMQTVASQRDLEHQFGNHIHAQAQAPALATHSSTFQQHNAHGPRLRCQPASGATQELTCTTASPLQGLPALDVLHFPRWQRRAHDDTRRRSATPKQCAELIQAKLLNQNTRQEYTTATI